MTDGVLYWERPRDWARCETDGRTALKGVQSMAKFAVNRASLMKYQGKELSDALFSLMQSASMGEKEAKWLSGLTRGQRTLYLLGQFDGTVCSDGLYDFFLSSAGDWTVSTLDALRLVGAAPVADLLDRAAKRFPNGCPSPDREERHEALEKLSIRTFRDIEDQYFSLRDEGKGALDYLARYLQSHEAEFFS